MAKARTKAKAKAKAKQKEFDAAEYLDRPEAVAAYLSNAFETGDSRVFNTFPFPDGLTPNIPAKYYAEDPQAVAIANAAMRLNDLRNSWLNPPDLVRIEPEIVSGYPDRVLSRDAAAAATLRERTLTNLYNQRPQWLTDAHRDLDAAVAQAYGWPTNISKEVALGKLLELNLSRAGTGELLANNEAAEQAED